MKKLLCPLFALLIVLSLSTAAFAADYSAEESANALYELGLFQGTGETANGKPIYSLDAAPTRAQAVTMLVRLLGKTREEANRVIEQMAERGIATNVHYKPLPMMTAYKKLGFDIKDFPNAYHLFENEITLPLNTKMTDEDLEYVIENFVDIVSHL